MPGVTLEDPFPIARFHNAIPSAGVGKHFVVDLQPVDQPLATEDDLSENQDQVLISVQSEGVKLYTTGDQKCLKSFTTPPGLVLAQPAVQRTIDETDYTFALVASGTDIPEKERNRIVWMWKSTQKSNDTDNRVSKTFDDRIHMLHVSSALTSQIILVNENGSIVLANNDLDRILAKSSHTSAGPVVWSTVFVTSNPHARPCCVSNSLVPVNSTIILTINADRNNANRYTVNLFYCNVERRSIDPMVKIDLTLKEKPVAFTFDPTDGRITALGAAGTWIVWRMQLRHTSVHKVIGDIEAHLSMQLSGYQLYNDKLGSIASLATLDDSYVALVAPRIKKGTDGPEHVVSIWDVKYGTLQAERSLQLGDKTAYGKDKCVYSISVLPNHHLAISVSSVATGANPGKKKVKAMADAKSVVVLCPYYNEPISLMAAMGKMNATVDFLGNNDTIGMTQSGYEGVGRPIKNLNMSVDDIYANWVQDLDQSQQKEKDLISKLLNPSITVEEFTNVFFGGAAGNKPEIAEKNATEIRKYNLILAEKSWQKVKAEFSYHFISTILPKCFSSPSFWPLEVFLYLLQTGQVRSSYLSGGIVNCVLERGDWALISTILHRVPDIPESDLITVLKAFIKARRSNTLSSEIASTLFAKIIDSPHNDIFMQQAVKRLEAAELADVLDLINDELESLSAKGKVQAFYSLIEFVSGVLDTHYPVIIMEPSLYDKIATLQDLIEREAAMAETMERVRGLVRPFERKQRMLAMEKQQTASHKTPRHKDHSDQGIPAYRVEIFQF
ncbi:hypothetical protein O0I10_005056 [Lichtheimia ornata]|uniref:Uncharacterized protein n=1 Tax=Lichtheimia ornata TaxID=688661 RepID=A0AAD7V6D2_9FUNG|nr:uncharacterized protein O0I10_005056 [Lichtheimia ornata]KAJ8659341.1 hypothetical protein O0I10_005056 [Lichtheimia ornata]